MNKQDFPWHLHFNEVVQQSHYLDKDIHASFQDRKKIDDDPTNSANDDLLYALRSSMDITHSIGEGGFVVRLPWFPRGQIMQGLPSFLTQERLARGNGDPVFVQLGALLRHAVHAGLYPPVKHIVMVNPPALIDDKIVPTLAILMDPEKGYDRPESARAVLEPLGYPSFGR